MYSSANLMRWSWLLLCVAVEINYGMYDSAAVGLLCLAWCAMAGAVWVKAFGNDKPASAGGAELGVTLMVAIALGYMAPVAMYVHDWQYQAIWRAGAGIMLGLVGAVIASRNESGRLFQAVFVYGVLFCFAMRIGLLSFSPNPEIDVFPMFQDSARHLFEGANPYDTAVSDAYAGDASGHEYGYAIFGYAYLPLNLMIQAPFWRVFHDIRAAHIFAEMITALAMYRMGRGSVRARWAILLFLWMPRGLFVIEQAWTEPLIVGAFALAMLAAERRPNSRGFAVAYGLMLGLKQYLIFFVLHGLIVERRASRIALAAAAAFSTLIPFLIWNWRSLIEYGVLFQLRTPFRVNALTLSSLLYRWDGLVIGKWISAAIGLGVGVTTFGALRKLGPAGLRLSAILTTFSIFVFGSQGFANYYYFILAMMTIHMAIEPTVPEKSALAVPAEALKAA